LKQLKEIFQKLVVGDNSHINSFCFEKRFFGEKDELDTGGDCLAQETKSILRKIDSRCVFFTNPRHGCPAPRPPSNNNSDDASRTRELIMSSKGNWKKMGKIFKKKIKNLQRFELWSQESKPCMLTNYTIGSRMQTAPKIITK
tara:strand:- start:767 stop:1195 length:429 start_codon:yes stop_codon:yes gene_type:complete